MKIFIRHISDFSTLLIISLLVIFMALDKVYSAESKIERGLFSSQDETRNVLVTFGSDNEIKGIVNQITAQHSYSSKEERIYAWYQSMSAYSKKCQSSAQSYLTSASYSYKHMWSSNTMLIHAADQACVKKLAVMSDVTTIRHDQTIPLIDPIDFGTQTSSKNDSLPAPFTTGTTWGLAIMKVKEAWKFNPGSYGYGNGNMKTGKGITVSSIDTGVNAKHEALFKNFRRYAGWMDGYNLTDTPEDKNGHGTHTMGTICGTTGIGVAPGAEWITCRGCFSRGCLESALLRCCEWIICPHDMDKTKPDNYRDCYTAPDLVSNSWGGGQGDNTFRRCAYALRAAGIIPIWAIGNAGPECATANSPGDLEEVIGVGASNENDEICWFSSRGPTVDGRLKPEISAPGMIVKSSWIPTPTSYISISGTSMATPHVSGLVALILERCRLPYETILNVLQSTAEKYSLGKTTQVCGGTKSDQFPNNFYGYGRVNALEAIKKAVKICLLNENYENSPYYPGNDNAYNRYYDCPSGHRFPFLTRPYDSFADGYGLYQRPYDYVR